MRIGVVTTSYPRFAGDPAGSFVAAHVEALRALGHAVDVVAAGDTPDRIPAGPLFYAGGAPEQFERAPLAAALAAAWFAPRFVAAVHARARQWDGVVAHWLAPSAIAALVATPRSLPLLAIAHGGDVHLLRRLHLLAPVVRALDRRGARIAYVSRALAALAPPTPRSFVQPMGVDVAHFAALPRAPTTPPTIAVLARLVPIKGVDRAIDAFAALAAPAHLAIAGEGPERAALEAQCRARGFDARGVRGAQSIAFLGELAAPARDALLARASVVVVPSRALANGRTEGTPLAALEALAAGIPVVADPTGGLADLPIHPFSALPTVLNNPQRVVANLPTWQTIAQRLTP